MRGDTAGANIASTGTGGINITAYGDTAVDRDGMFSRSGAADQRQFFPVSTDRVWAALTAVLADPGRKVKSTDDMLMRAEVSTGMTAMTWGANLVVQVEPAEQDGAAMVITAASKFPAAETGPGS